MPSQHKLDSTFLQMASVFGNLSSCNRAKVGALITKDSRVISTGYNGFPAGFGKSGCSCEDRLGLTKAEVIHAEANAILFLAKYGISAAGATLYTDLSPCFACSVLILQAGITRVVYKNEYRDVSGLKFLQANGVEVCQLQAKPSYEADEGDDEDHTTLIEDSI